MLNTDHSRLLRLLGFRKIGERKFDGLIIWLVNPIQDLDDQLVSAVGRIGLVDVGEDLLVVANWDDIAYVPHRRLKFLDLKGASEELLDFGL